MKTKLYKTYSRAARIAITECVRVSDSDQQMFAHFADLSVAGKEVLAQRTFAWIDDGGRTLQLVRLAAGDIGFRAYGSGLGNDTDNRAATRIFDDETIAREWFDRTCAVYFTDESKARGWREITV